MVEKGLVYWRHLETKFKAIIVEELAFVDSSGAVHSYCYYLSADSFECNI